MRNLRIDDVLSDADELNKVNRGINGSIGSKEII